MPLAASACKDSVEKRAPYGLFFHSSHTSFKFKKSRMCSSIKALASSGWSCIDGLISIVTVFARQKDALPVLLSRNDDIIVRFHCAMFKQCEMEVPSRIIDSVGVN